MSDSVTNFCMSLDVDSLETYIKLSDNKQDKLKAKKVLEAKKKGYLLAAILDKIVEDGDGNVELFYANAYSFLDPTSEIVVSIGFNEVEYDGEDFEDILKIDYPNAFSIQVKVNSNINDADEEMIDQHLEAIREQVPPNVKYYNMKNGEITYLSKSKSNLAALIPDLMKIYEYFSEDISEFYKESKCYKDKSIEDKLRIISEYF